MKKKLVLVGFIGFTFLFGCSQINNEVDANSERWFTKVHSEHHSNNNLTVIKHNGDGCYYLITTNTNSGGVVQMMVEKDGVTVPYCEGAKK